MHYSLNLGAAKRVAIDGCKNNSNYYNGGGYAAPAALPMRDSSFGSCIQ